MLSQAIVFPGERSRDTMLRKLLILLTVEDNSRTFCDCTFWLETMNDKIDSI